MRLTLGELLDQPEFGLRLCAGGEESRMAPVDGAHSTDVREPVRWLQESWLMLTTGVHLRGRASAQRRLVAQLADGGIAALGLGLGIVMQRAPRALLEEAEKRSFPVLTVPLETPFKDIVLYVNRSALSADFHLLHRLVSMQRYLLDAMHQPRPEQALLERLGSLLGGAAVAHVDHAGRPVTTTAPDVAWYGFPLCGIGSHVREVEHAGRSAVAVPVLEGATPSGWLVVLRDRMSVPSRVAGPVMQTASELLGLVGVTRGATGRERSERRERLGARMLRVVKGESDDGLASALAAHGLDFTRPCRLAVFKASDEPPLVPDRLRRLQAALEGVGFDLVMAPDGEAVVLLAQSDLAGLADWIMAQSELAAVRAGVSEPLGRMEQIGQAVVQARLALAVALTAPGRPAVQRHEDLDPTVALLGADGFERVRSRLRQTLAPLDAEPRLRAAVTAYLEAELDIGRAAQMLALHRNSLRYRLDRSEKLLGRSLRSPATVTTLYLALLAERLRA